VRFFLCCLALTCLLPGVAARAEDIAASVLAFAGCTLSGPCELTTDEHRTVIEARSGSYVGWKVLLSAPESRGFSVLMGASRRPYLIEFSGPADSSLPPPAALEGSSVRCTSEIVQFGSVRRHSRGIPGLLGFGQLTYFIALADDMTPADRSESLQAIDRWLADAEVDPLLVSGSSFMDDPNDVSIFEPHPWVGIGNQLSSARKRLGPHFKGAIVACGWLGDLSPRLVWQTRLLDLTLAPSKSSAGPDQSPG